MQQVGAHRVQDSAGDRADRPNHGRELRIPNKDAAHCIPMSAKEFRR
jgi:hypothetical protein